MTETTYDEVVAAGANWLDHYYPDWVTTVNLDTLDQSSTEHCVLSQAAQCSYQTAVIRHELRGDNRVMVTKLGFALGYESCSSPEYTKLTDTWVSYIYGRRGIRSPITVETVETVPAAVTPKLYSFTVNNEFHGYWTWDAIDTFLANSARPSQMSIEEYKP